MPPQQTSRESLCALCGRPIPTWAPAGNCPACLLSGANGTGQEPQPRKFPAREKVGDWTLIERIGEGAFGVVYSAEQTRPVRRSGAVKILRPGMASGEVLARFEAESQALALMNHPDVVTIYDANTGEDGRPWFAMELVPGHPITEFATGLSLGEKLTLFDRVCAVVEHAHRHGIIHRDLKPANVLVYRNESDGTPVLKLLDFGIAKATDQLLTEATILTRKDHFLGTPEYTSPEQAAGGDIDTRSDIYSLGVILYELLAGRPPFVLASSALDDVVDFLRRVRDETPPPPSSFANSPLPQDLDWIALKAVEKDRGRRYHSVSGLREDLRRYREDRPIEARPPDTLYIARKFLHRHRKAVTVTAAIAATLVASVIVSGYMALKAARATRETRAAYSLSDFQSGVDALDRLEISRSIAYLVRSLRTDPHNREAAMLLRSTLGQFPTSRLIRRIDLTDEILQVAEILDDEGSSILVTEKGRVLFVDDSGSPSAPEINFGGTNQRGRLSPNGRLLAITNIQGELGLVDVAARRILPLERPQDFPFLRVRDIVFSPKGERICLSFFEGGLASWDTESRKLQWVRALPSSPLATVFFGMGSGVAVALADGQRQDFVAATGEPSHDIPQQSEPVADLVGSGSGYRYYTVSTAGIISACDAGREPRSFTTERVSVPLLLSASDPGRRLVAYLARDEASVWTVAGATIIRRFPLPNPPTAVSLLAPQGHLFIGTAESGILPWDFDRNQLSGSQISLAKNTLAIRVDPDKSLLRCLGRDGSYQVYEIPPLPDSRQSSEEVLPEWASLPLADRSGGLLLAGTPAPGMVPPITGGTLRAGAALPDGSAFFGAYRDGFIRVWRKGNDNGAEEIPTGTSSVRCLDVSHDGRFLGYRDLFSRVAIVDLETGEKHSLNTYSKRDVSSISFSPSGTAFAIATDAGEIRIFETATLEERFQPLRHETRGNVVPHFCRFSLGGSILATWSASDRAIRLWNAEHGNPIGILPVRDGNPQTVLFHSEDKLLLSVVESDSGKSVWRLWALPSLLPVTPEQTLDPALHDFSDVAIPDDDPFSPDQLREVEVRNGLALGDKGFLEVNE